VGGIDAFEANLRRLGAGTTAELVPADITPLTGRDPAAHLAALQRSLPDARVRLPVNPEPGTENHESSSREQ
jgi:hypothetical protein